MKRCERGRYSDRMLWDDSIVRLFVLNAHTVMDLVLLSFRFTFPWP
jgi:hypothetical protein